MLEELALFNTQPNTRIVKVTIALFQVQIYCDSNKLNVSPKKEAIAVTLYDNSWYKVLWEKKSNDKHKQFYLERYISDMHEYDLVDYKGRSLFRWEVQYEQQHEV